METRDTDLLAVASATFEVVGRVHMVAAGCGFVELRSRYGVFRVKCRAADADGLKVGELVRAVGEIRPGQNRTVVLMAWSFDPVVGVVNATSGVVC